ncbi:ABC transporter substrate-binding protein [Xylophilus sp. GOD-11R]|uniref:ABC transporter substrate-binding protein n=1 Tax=Xylophilus sp. GOD-11R TaxID=3089814 RepID=UPI00298D04BD|nr:ABC transporter substrate-binding protein [Xylophilus sp. GOD-11R]WPB55770.1 ABC transporter substrate-binding protein [Xylophilus sp. GOD-11R]
MSTFSRRQMLSVIGASVAAPAVVRAQDTSPIKIGGMLPLSGPAAIEGAQVRKGYEFAVAEANARGGVFGRKIELVLEDDEGNATKGVNAVRKLIERDKVPFIIGTYPTAVCVAATKVAREYKVAMISGGSTAVAGTDANTVGDPWFFRPWTDSNGQGADTAKAIVHQFHGKKVAIIHDLTNYGVTLADQAAAIVPKEGSTIVAREGFNAGEKDFSTLLTRLRTLRPDVVYVAGWAGDGATIVRQAAEVGLRAQFIGSGSMLSDDFIKLAGPASEGFAVATLYEATTPNKVGRAFGERFKAVYKHEAGTLNSLGFDSTSIGIEAMRRVGRPDSAAIQQMIKGGMKDFPLVQGPDGTTAAFDDKGGVTFPMFIAIVKNGKRTLS